MTVDVEGDRAVALGGDPEHPFTQGFLCAKVNRYLERVYSPERILHPLKRVGPKGEGRFERISWDQALDEIAERLPGVVDAHGPQAILPYSYAGNLGILGYGSMDRRFFQALGASLLDRTICATAGARGFEATVGATMGYDPEAIVDARLIVAWGTNIVSSNVHQWPFIEEARPSRRASRHRGPLPLADRGEVGPAPGASPRDRRRPRPGDDARHLPRRARGPRVPRAPHRGRRRPARAGPRVDAGARPPRPRASRSPRSRASPASTPGPTPPRSG